MSLGTGCTQPEAALAIKHSAKNRGAIVLRGYLKPFAPLPITDENPVFCQNEAPQDQLSRWDFGRSSLECTGAFYPLGANWPMIDRTATSGRKD